MNFFNKMLVITALMISHNALSEVVVIVNKSNSGDVDATLVKKIYLGKAKAFSNGEKVTVYTLPTNQDDTEYFREKALSKSNSQFKSYWSKLVFTGKGTPATEVDSAADIIAAVKKDPSAIGFVNSNDVNDEVKVVVNY
ncbi:phosphate ABC transporter substrate-binding protein [Colwellia sp. D2M02]|uniref:phosphate ABC transporter substrate-binding protein n=1 Tax=Colwellia sp. D2M02 TaxID=2841562 RepID=UPI001C09225B|nr:phosphate ABC transporter substrate-binding protein [Colwellia sp. D2M02]MBU2893780.1 phosphate ABC transporter substrate-binding protein [Colwellia sp. D2M02]